MPRQRLRESRGLFGMFVDLNDRDRANIATRLQRRDFGSNMVGDPMNRYDDELGLLSGGRTRKRRAPLLEMPPGRAPR